MSQDDENFGDPEVYKSEEIFKYGQEFLAKVDPRMVQELDKNKDWFAETQHPLLMNLNYPSKLQTDYLKSLELEQQKRSDLKY